MSESSDYRTTSVLKNQNNLQEIVDRFIAETFILTDGCKPIIFSPRNNKFYQWESGHYDKIEDRLILMQIQSFLDNVYVKVKAPDKTETVAKIQNNIHKRHEILDRLKNTLSQGMRTGFVPGIRNDWLYDPEYKFPDPSMIIPMENCILDINEFLEAKRQNLPRKYIAEKCIKNVTPRLCNTWNLPCRMHVEDYQNKLPLKFLAFLGDIFEEDYFDENRRECIKLILEWTGYMLTEDTSFHKMLLLIGEAGSGKSTIIRCMQAILGAKNYVTPNVANFISQWGFSSWVGKRAAFFADMRLTDYQKAIAQQNILAVSGEDEVEVSTKFEMSVQAKLPTKIVIASNSMPEFANDSTAFSRRILLIPFERSIPKEKVIGNIEKTFLAEEMNLIIWLCLDSYFDLKTRGKFLQPGMGNHSLANFRDEENTARAFALAKCKFDRDSWIEKKHLYGQYKYWCETNGYKETDYLDFCKRMNRSFGSKVNSGRRGSGGSTLVFEGIEMKSPFSDISTNE